MKELSSFSEVNEALARYVSPARETKYTLDRMYKLMDFLGNPQDKLKIIHVAGTSGKTSTCYYVAALLHAAGYKVGHTVSPHVSEVNERLQINLVPLSESEFCHELSEFLELITKSGLQPSYFELLVALAYWEFVRQKVDYAVVEVGLGGLKDGTNIIDRKDKVCVVTDIGFDHVKVLGNTLTEIASQKAGIIQPGNKVFSYSQSPEIMQVIKKRCSEQQARLNIVKAQSLTPDFDFLPLFQKHNFGLAQMVTSYVLSRDGHAPLINQQLLRAAKTRIPARMEIFRYKGKTIIIDGAHNAQKLHALIKSIQAKFPGQSAAVLISFSALNADTRMEKGLQEITNLASYVIATEFATTQDMYQQSVDSETIKQASRAIGFNNVEIIRKPEEAFVNLLARPESLLLVTGSFYLLNHIRPLMLKSDND